MIVLPASSYDSSRQETPTCCPSEGKNSCREAWKFLIMILRYGNHIDVRGGLKYCESLPFSAKRHSTSAFQYNRNENRELLSCQAHITTPGNFNTRESDSALKRYVVDANPRGEDDFVGRGPGLLILNICQPQAHLSCLRLPISTRSAFRRYSQKCICQCCLPEACAVHKSTREQRRHMSGPLASIPILLIVTVQRSFFPVRISHWVRYLVAAIGATATRMRFQWEPTQERASRSRWHRVLSC